jgi:hypothetical protein
VPPADEPDLALFVSGPKKVKKGKKAVFKVAIKNTGDGAATGVSLQVIGGSKKLNNFRGQIAANSRQDFKVAVKAARTGKLKLTFKLIATNAPGKTVKKTVTAKK